jgi:hypothetical protein
MDAGAWEGGACIVERKEREGERKMSFWGK